MESSYEVLSSMPSVDASSSVPVNRPADIPDDATEESVMFSPSNAPDVATDEEDALVERLVKLTADEVLRRHDQTLAEGRRLRIQCQRLRRELDEARRQLESRDRKLALVRRLHRELAQELEEQAGVGSSSCWTSKDGVWKWWNSENAGYVCWGLLAVAQTVVTFGILCAIRS